MHITVASSRADSIRQSGTLPAPLSTATDSPRVLDNLQMWTGIALVLVALAYALPLYSIVEQQGLFGNGVGTYPVVIELLRGHLPVGLVEFFRHFPTTAVDATVGLLEVVR
jgi:cytochrome c oxidase subunit 1